LDLLSIGESVETDFAKDAIVAALQSSPLRSEPRDESLEEEAAAMAEESDY
jgi:hypothetical protein